MRQIQPKHIIAVGKVLTTEPQSIQTIAKRLRCSRNSAVRRLEAYRKAVAPLRKVRSKMVREGLRGPESIGFYVGE